MGKREWAALAALLLSLAATFASSSLEPFDEAQKANTPSSLLYTTFQDHAVLQRDKPIPVWGVTSPAAQVTVILAGRAVSTTANATGNWQVSFPPMQAGGPYDLAATSSTGQKQTISDVMLGDVYLCSGQSNMEMPMRLATSYDSEIQSATNTKIRLFHVQRYSSPVLQATFGAGASWRVTSPDSVKEFSAVCYYFARDVQPTAGVPIGLIEAAWGGSPIQAWMSQDKLRAIGGYEEPLEILRTYPQSPQNALAKWQTMARAWWRMHDPALGALPAWKDWVFDDTGWDHAVPTGNWRTWNVAPLKKFEGLVWLRKSFDLTASQARGSATLSLGAIDRTDTTWINGVDIGEFEGPETKRVYTVPEGALRQGKNVLAIGVLAGGGLLSPAEQLTLKFADGSAVSLGGDWRYRLSVPFRRAGQPPHVPWLDQQGVSVLYNGMIMPLGPTPIRAVIWYQGESDAWQAKEYARLLPAMVDDWRARFGTETPFFIVQLPAFGSATTRPQRSDWAALREVQRRVPNTTANLAMAVTIDLGARDNMHPAAKQEVGRRLALIAKKHIYGSSIVDSGPTPLSVVRRSNIVTVTFEHVSKGLSAYEWDGVIGFMLCDTKENCSYVDGTIERDGVRLDASKRPEATRVRFCWSDSPLCNLYNSEGLPAGPFEAPIADGKTKSIRKPRRSVFRRTLGRN